MKNPIYLILIIFLIIPLSFNCNPGGGSGGSGGGGSGDETGTSNTKIVFHRETGDDPDGDSYSNIFTMDIDGTNVQTITSGNNLLH